jgi:hypothetical protein
MNSRVQVEMEIQGMIRNLRHELVAFKKAADEASRIDLSDDPHYVACLQAMQTALELEGCERKNQQINVAMVEMRQGLTIDLSDTAGQRVSALVVPYIEKLDKLLTEAKHRCQEADKGEAE